MPCLCGVQVTVEVQKKNGGYELLTFTLVGSIAGVVLAVTIIYLLKRHRRSREKLAQLASTGDGNEASKDYQVRWSVWALSLIHISEPTRR